ncbi:MAG: hypothetical protein M1426_05580 [Patescibacteria group bacterium]|nr:hypothetical protein [Patescibacteria group bacterium]
MTMTKRILIFLILFLFGITQISAQTINYNHPELEWQTIETEHFVIHFHQGEDRTPKVVAKIAEEIYQSITQLYQYVPREKIHFIIRDTDDYANGATYYYDNKIDIWSLPMDFALRGTHNWLRNVITHEFTHMIHMQRARKITRHTPGVFFQWLGYEKEKRKDVVYGFPNIIASYPIAMTIIPGWFAEGVAQYTTERFGYDAWDSHRDMIIRMRVLSNNLLSIDEMGSFGKNRLGNESLYNQGYSLVRYIAEKYGVETLEKLTKGMQKQRYLTFNAAVRNVLKMTESELHNNWRKSLEEYYSQALKTIQTNEVNGDIVQQAGFANLFPAWSPNDNDYAFLSNRGADYLAFTNLYLMKSDSKKLELIEGGVQFPPVWFTDGSGFVYIHQEKTSTGCHYNDLYLYDRNTRRSRRLTYGQRAFYPSISHDGKYIAFARVQDGTFNLAVIQTETGKIRQVTDFTDSHQIFQSVWTPDDKQIIFSCSRDAARQIASINSDGTGMKYLLQGENDFRDPVLSPDGKTLYYSADITGIFNIYRMDIVTGRQELLTNVTGGAFMPSVNKRGELLFAQYMNEGYRISLLKKPVSLDTSRAVYKSSYRTSAITFNDVNPPQYSAKPYKTTYTQTTIVPRVMMDYKRPKAGVTGYASDYLDQYSFLGAFAMNSILDYDGVLSLEYKKYKPTLFLDVYNISRRIRARFPEDPELDQPGEHDQIRFTLLEVDLGIGHRLSDTQTLRGTLVYSRYNSKVKNLTPIPGIPNQSFTYNYLLGTKMEVEWNYQTEARTVDAEINPSYGRDLSVRIAREQNKFITDFAFNERIGTFEEVYKPYKYNSLFVDWREHYRLPIGIRKNAFTLNVQAGMIDRTVDSFFNFFAGGFPGIKGYSFYSIEGRKMLINSLTYRTPIIPEMNRKIVLLYLNKLYGGVTYFWGNAWSQKDIPWDKFKRSIDFQLRLDAFSFYNYPTRIAFDAAYGFDRFQNLGGVQGREWRFYLQILFDYMF